MEKSAIVTGSSRGIGFAIAKQLCVDGYNVVMVATGPKEKNADAVAALEKLGTKIHYVQANIADHDDRLRIVDEALKARDQMAWVARMNNIRHRAEECILAELIFE
jgi:NAD(P)-dependent dehydrogenase (short-subunit alcohol dehydrogenase family)